MAFISSWHSFSHLFSCMFLLWCRPDRVLLCPPWVLTSRTKFVLSRRHRAMARFSLSPFCFLLTHCPFHLHPPSVSCENQFISSNRPPWTTASRTSAAWKHLGHRTHAYAPPVSHSVQRLLPVGGDGVGIFIFNQNVHFLKARTLSYSSSLAKNLPCLLSIRRHWMNVRWKEGKEGRDPTS